MKGKLFQGILKQFVIARTWRFAVYGCYGKQIN